MAVLKTRIGLFRKKQDFAPQTTEEFLRILEDEVDRLSGMVDSLLKLTSLEQVPRTDRIELSELLHQVTEDVSSLFSGKGMHISTEAAPGSIQGSRELLRRALFNLVENAVKYGPEGGEVQIHAEPDGANAAITVSDQGPRIPPELRERIFEPFFRLDTARSRDLGGTGLGLARWRESVLAPAPGRKPLTLIPWEMEKRKLPQGWSWGNMRHAPTLSYPLEAGLYTANKAGRAERFPLSARPASCLKPEGCSFTTAPSVTHPFTPVLNPGYPYPIERTYLRLLCPR